MKNLIKTYEMLVKTCEEEIELNGLRSISYEFWLKGKKKSYEKILEAINNGLSKKEIITELELRVTMSEISVTDCNKNKDITVAHKAWVKGLLDGYKESLSHIQNYE